MEDQFQARNQFVISLVQRSEFHSLQRDYRTLYKNFSFLSYISRSSNIRIIDRYPFKDDKSIEVDYFLVDKVSQVNQQEIQRNKSLYLFQVKKDDFSHENKMVIIYQIGQNPDSISKENRITVTFHSETQMKLTKKKIKETQYIYIKIQDQTNWIQNNINIKTKTINRLSQHRSLTDNQIEYFYKEPQSKRTREVKGRHLSIALQGGGAKGVSYIGVADALKEFYGDEVKAKTIIGSSAGGILGLAFCLDLSQEEVVNIGIKGLSTITSEDKKYINNQRDEQENLLNLLKKFMKDYNLFEPKIVDYIEKAFKNEGFQRAFLNLIDAFNPSLVDLFTFQENNKNYATIYGLLMASLMKGQVLKGISVDFLKIFKKKVDMKPMDEKDLSKWAENVTLQELYEINGVEFTCTSVDLRSHTLRFFNHKSTPNLPVCKAVQMTGSFPVVFESQVWKPEWGKYYVHYCNTRKEIDLTGVNFTDGGMLANFPVKYLDNENMRPMYFAHKRYPKDSENETLLYGFGLNELTEKSEEETKKFSEALSALAPAFKNSLSYWDYFRIATSWASGKVVSGSTETVKVSDQENPITRLQQIPMFQFLFDLLETYKQSKDKLTVECFETETYTIPIKTQNRPEKDLLFSPYDHETFTVEFDKFMTKFQLNAIVDPGTPIERVISNLTYIYQLLQKCNETESNLIVLQTSLNHILSSYCFERSMLRHRQKIPNSQIVKDTFHQRLIKMDTMKKSKHFFNCNIKRDLIQLLQIANESIKYFKAVENGDYEKLYPGQKAQMEEVLRILVKQEIDHINQIYKELRQYDKKMKNSKQYISFDEKLVMNICNIRKNCIALPLSNIIEIIQELQETPIHELRVKYDVYDHRRQLKQYIQRRIQKYQDCKSIHVVLQSAPLAQKYLLSYMIDVQKTINDYNLNVKKQEEEPLSIRSITSNNYYSVAAFLYASDFSKHKLEEQIWKVQALIEINPDISKVFESKSWQKIYPVKMKQLQDQIWVNRRQAFSIVQNLVDKIDNDNDLKEFNKNIKNVRATLQNSRDEVDEALEVSLAYIVDEVSLYGSDAYEESVSKLGQQLSLNLERKRKDYYKENKKKNQNIAYILDQIFQHYGDILKYLIFSESNIKQVIIRNLNKEERKQAWKGLLIGKLLSFLKVKNYIREKLQEMGLKRQTTLLQYYELTKKQIHLNFTAVQIPANIVTFINHKTRPYMPVWAAITASCSIPFFFKAVSDKAQWKYKPDVSKSQRIAKQFFNKQEPESNFLHSANLLVRFPLELVTNEKIKTLITNQKNQVFFNFAFCVKEFENPTKNQELKIQQLTITEAASLGGSMPTNFGALVSSIPFIRSRMSALSTYVNSHDNLIMEIYQKQIVILPIRVGTIDFNKMTKPGPNNSTLLSDVAQDAVEQAKYVTYQKFENESNQKKHLFVKVQKNKKSQLQIRFLSMLNYIKGKETYRIFYKLDQNDTQYVELVDEKVILKSKSLWIKVIFPELVIDKEEKERYYKKSGFSHHLDLNNFSKLNNQNNFSYTYKFVFNKYNSLKQLAPLSINRQLPQIPMLINSFIENNSQKNKLDEQNYCNKCFQSLQNCQIIKNQEQAQKECENKDSNGTKLFIRCRNCQAEYCLKCKFIPTFSKQGARCRFNHQFLKDKTRLEHYEETNHIIFVKCDYCQKNGQIYTDQECGIDICELCALEFYSQN